MAAKTRGRLPAGWTVGFRVQKNGRRIEYYINSTTGQKFFSKEDLLRYTKMKRTQIDEPQPTSGRDKRHSKNVSTKPVSKEKNCQNGHGKRHSENSSMEFVALEENRPEWLPDGWIVDLKTRKSGSSAGQQYKVYIDPMTGCKFFSKPEVLRHLESIKHRNLECKGKTISIGASSSSKVVIEKSTVADLPPGWIKETKIKKTARGVRKDPYYIDPVSGYVFCSKKDVFRYLETGEISKHAFKPRKRDIDVPESINEEALPLPAAKRQKLEQPATRRQLFPVKESSDVCSPTFGESDVQKKRQGTAFPGAPMAEISSEQMVEMTIEKGAETKEKAILSSSAQPNFKDSKRNQGKSLFANNGPVSTPAIDSLRGQRLPESQTECSNGKSPYDLSKSDKKQKLNLPRRSSKRLAGLEPEPVANGLPIEQALKNVTTESYKSKAVSAAGLTCSGFVDEISWQLKAGSVIGLADHVSSEVNIPSSTGPSNKMKPSGNQALLGEQNHKLKSAETIDDKSEQHGSLFFGDSYLDPCLESAFKALMNNTPVNSNPDSGPVSTPAADILQEKNLQTSKLEKRSSRKTQINSMQSKNKQELILPRRSSNRLAGREPEMVTNSVSLEQVPRKVTIESCKSTSIQAAGLNSSILVDEASQQLKAGSLIIPANQLSSSINIPLNRESSNTIKPVGSLAILGEQSAETNDEKSELLVLSSSGNSYLDPCKALMGEIMVDCVPGNGLVSTTVADILKEKNLQETNAEKSSNKQTLVNWVKSKNKQELDLPRRSSKRLAGLEPELVANSISVEGAFGNVTIEPCKNEVLTRAGVDPHGLADSASQRLEIRHETTLAQHDFTAINTPLHEKSTNESSKPIELEAQTVNEQSQKSENEKQEQPKKLENERIDGENPNPLLFPFEGSWSDPCLEFAFKTLTGAIPVDDHLAIQDYFQYQLDPSDKQRDGSSGPPDFGSINSFQTSSFQFDAPAKQPASEQQLPSNHLPSQRNVSIPSCSTIASQQPCLERNKEFNGKVSSS